MLNHCEPSLTGSLLFNTASIGLQLTFGQVRWQQFNQPIKYHLLAILDVILFGCYVRQIFILRNRNLYEQLLFLSSSGIIKSVTFFVITKLNNYFVKCNRTITRFLTKPTLNKWRSGHQLCLPPLRPGIDSQVLHVGEIC